MISKSELRKIMRAKLRVVPEQVIAEASSAICNHLIPHCKNASNIAIFSAHGPEVDLSDLHRSLPSKNLLYPLCHSGGILTFHRVSDIAELNPGTLGILEPNPQIHPEVPLSEIDTYLCPGLAFGRDGSRLGHGGGFYDRALIQRSPSAQVLGVCLQLQVLDSIPTDKHDIPIDHLITETGLIF